MRQAGGLSYLGAPERSDGRPASRGPDYIEARAFGAVTHARAVEQTLRAPRSGPVPRC